MTSLLYDTIYSSFLGEITDYSFVNRSEVESKEVMQEMLHKSVATPYVKHIFAKSSLDDSSNVFNYELRHSSDDEQSDNDFVCLLLGMWMSFQWTKDKVKSIENTAQFFGTKEQKFYSQANHLDELLKLKDDTYTEARKLISEHGYIARSKK